MLKLAKLTDYGIVLMGYMAKGQGESRAARELSDLSGLPLPTVSKVLKSLSKGGLLVSHRGKKGGYSLAMDPKDISVAEMIRVMEGPVQLTDCSNTHVPTLCEMEAHCPVRSNWQVINDVVFEALTGFSLAQMLEKSSCSSQAGQESNAGTNLLELVKS
jgi:FeS assembly SUF system regulator